MTTEQSDLNGHFETRVSRACLLMEDRLPETVPVAELASAASFSVRNFQKVFKKVVGESVRDHQLRLRLEMAAWRLRHSDWPIGDVAREVQFDSHSGFTRAFQKQFQMSPGAWRESATTIALRSSIDSRVARERMSTCSLSPMIVEVPELRVAAMRYMGPTLGIIGVWRRLRKLIVEHKLQRPEMQLIGMHHDTWDVAESDYRYDACVTVPPSVALPAGVIERVIPAGAVAVAHVSGSLFTIEAAWHQMVNVWFPASGVLLRGNYGFDRYPTELILESRLKQIFHAFNGVNVSICLPIETPCEASVRQHNR